MPSAGTTRRGGAQFVVSPKSSRMTDLLESPRTHVPAARRTVALLGLGTAVPPAATQSDALSIVRQFGCQTAGQRAWLGRVFAHAGVETRSSVLLGAGGMADVERFFPPAKDPSDLGPTTAARMQRYAQEAPPLAHRAAQAALADARLPAAEITHLITVSCTGFFAPGLDAALITSLGLPPAIRRQHLGFMGCHAAFNALAAARDIVLAHPHARVLVCSVELSTLHFTYGWDPEKLVTNALFADGAAACVVGATSRGTGPLWHLLQTASLLVPASAAAMTWRIGDHGFEMTLSAELPTLITSRLRDWCVSWLADEALAPADIALWAIHPGGPKIIAAAAESLALPDSATAPSRALLARHGNMSSATVLFLLQDLAPQAPAGAHCVAIGFGPGLMLEGMLLRAG